MQMDVCNDTIRTSIVMDVLYYCTVVILHRDLRVKLKRCNFNFLIIHVLFTVLKK